MKIHQLPHGARFLHQGEEFVKTGPMLGTGKHGQKMFPRYLELQALDEVPAVPKNDKMLAMQDVLAAFATFHAECRDLIGADKSAALNAARDRFLKALD